MASLSDPPTVGEATVAASDPPPPSSSTSKRRWSPCTWRYAIEEGQPELGSRPRSSPFYAGAAATASRGASEQTAAASATVKARLHHQEKSYGREAEESRRSLYGSRADRAQGAEPAEVARGKHSRAEERLNSKKRQQQHHHQPHQPKEAAKRRSPKEEEEEEEEEEDEDDDDDEEEEEEEEEELEYHGEEDNKSRKREMSPSELYYCDICATKAAAAKSNIKGSSSPLQDS